MEFENARKRFQEAVGVLSDERDRIKERLLIAYASQLSRIDRNGDLPGPMVKEFDELRYALSDAEMPYGYGEHAQRKLQEMSEDEASALARRIFGMFLKLHEFN
jgi:hypothetical protein